jgi:hypothetical protein
LQFASCAGTEYYLALDGHGGSRIVPLQGAPERQFETGKIIDLLKTAGGRALAEVRVLDRYDAYYLDRTRRLPLPVIYVRLTDEHSTRYYIDPRSARIVGDYNSDGWANRWLYHGLHSLNFPWLYNYRPLWDVVVISLLLGGAALCLTSLVLAWRVLKRKIPAVLPFYVHHSIGSDDLIGDEEHSKYG